MSDIQPRHHSLEKSQSEPLVRIIYAHHCSEISEAFNAYAQDRLVKILHNSRVHGVDLRCDKYGNFNYIKAVLRLPQNKRAVVEVSADTVYECIDKLLPRVSNCVQGIATRRNSFTRDTIRRKQY